MALHNKQQPKGAYEARMGDLGMRQANVAGQFAPALSHIQKQSGKDHTNTLRGRANADAVSSFKDAAKKTAHAAASGNSHATQGIANFQGKGASKAKLSATAKGRSLKDSAITSSAKIALGDASQTQQGLAAAARDEFRMLNADTKAAETQAKAVQNTVAKVGGAMAGRIKRDMENMRSREEVEAYMAENGITKESPLYENFKEYAESLTKNNWFGG